MVRSPNYVKYRNIGMSNSHCVLGGHYFEVYGLWVKKGSNWTTFWSHMLRGLLW